MRELKKNDFNNISQPLEQINESLSKVQCKLKRNPKSIPWLKKKKKKSATLLHV